jgi:spore germination protein YaaH
MERYGPKPFFSKELCTYYFTYRHNDEAHFVMYDNAASISAKLSLGKKLGIEEAFLLYPEIEDVLPHIEI